MHPKAVGCDDLRAEEAIGSRPYVGIAELLERCTPFFRSGIDWPAEYARMAAQGQWDEAALPKPKLPNQNSPDADEKRLGTRRKVSVGPWGTAGSCGKRQGLPPTQVPACLCRP